MRIVAADSGAAILNERFKPMEIVALAAVLVECPYDKANDYFAEPIFVDVDEGPFLLISELEGCQRLLKRVKANIVHLDMSLGGIKIGELSAVNLSRLKISSKARSHILRILPRLRKAASEIKRVYGLDVIAIGKNSIPVRIAELTCGAHALIYCAKKVIEEQSEIILGLPSRCLIEVSEGNVFLKSLMPAEHTVMGYARDKEGVLDKIQIDEMLNPRARGFLALKIFAKK